MHDLGHFRSNPGLGRNVGCLGRNIKKEIRDSFIQNRLEKLMPWISGSYIPIKELSDDPTKLFPKRGYLDLWDWLDFIDKFITNSLILFFHSEQKAQPWGGLKADISEAFRPTETGVRGQSSR